MNSPTVIPNEQSLGFYHKYNVTRADDDPTGKHANDEYFVLNLTTDKHAIPALAAYAESCAAEYPALAADLRAKIAETATAANEFVAVYSILRDWIKAQVVAVETGLISFEEVFMAHVLLPNGQRMIEHARTNNLLPNKEQ